MVNSKWFVEDKKQLSLAWQKYAKDDKIPLSVYTKIGTPRSKKCPSIYEPSISYFSQVGGVMFPCRFSIKLVTGKSRKNNLRDWEFGKVWKSYWYNRCNTRLMRQRASDEGLRGMSFFQCGPGRLYCTVRVRCRKIITDQGKEFVNKVRSSFTVSITIWLVIVVANSQPSISFYTKWFLVPM